METTIMSAQRTETELKEKLDYAKNETQHAIDELQQYRLRATNQLQLKERQIEQLKSGNMEKTGDENNDGEMLELEVVNLRSERDHLQSELNLLTHRLEESRAFIERMEHKHRMMQSEAEDKVMALDASISQMSLKCAQYEEEVKHHKQEMAQVRDEMLKQKTSMTTKLHEK